MSGCCGGNTTIKVEFDYLVVEGETCDRCGDSREGVRAAVADAQRMLSASGYMIVLQERELDASQLADSNRVLINGTPAEEWLGGSSTASDCPSCSDLVGERACCRAVEVGGVASDALSRDLVLDAIMAAAGLAPAAPANDSCCAPSRSGVAVTLVTGPGCG